jgi:predicted RecA/RadA family phage recombinase
VKEAVMASNFITPPSPEKIRTVTLGGTVTAGSPVYLNGVLSVYLSSGVSGDVVSVATDGVCSIAATNPETWTKGDALYWDPGTSKLTNIAGALVRVGTAYAAKADVTTTGYIDLQLGA